jgi:NAD(P)-dependent dehydrogenase (short-subunit alcohol dehydrogenase family)
MVARDEGRILFTSSIASTMPGAFEAVYNASKSFVQSFALALRNELKDTNVTITSLMPGPTETECFERADMLDTKVGASEKDDPADVSIAPEERRVRCRAPSRPSTAIGGSPAGTRSACRSRSPRRRCVRRSTPPNP